MSKFNELAVINPQEVQLVPTPEEFTMVREDMGDMDRIPYGRIQIAAGGANVFKVLEPGEEEPITATDVTGVILLSHRANGLWLGAYGKGDDKAPVCSSANGEDGFIAATGETVSCERCPHNQYGSADGGNGRGKACKNMRRVYIMRPGDIFPLILTLPPSSLSVFDKYRTKVMLGRKRMYAVVTCITLKSKRNNDGIEYSVPSFEAVAVLPPVEAERIRQYAEQFSGAAANVGISGDDYDAPEQTYVHGEGYDTEPQFERQAPPPAPDDGEFTSLDDVDLPPRAGTKTGA